VTSIFTHDYQRKAQAVFLTPTETAAWSAIAASAVTVNTFRGFHRIDKNHTGAMKVFSEYFTSNAKSVIGKIQLVQSREDLHRLSQEICGAIREQLTNIREAQLNPFNKIRKPSISTLSI